MKTKKPAWKYRVVKRQRGMEGEWFDYPGRGFVCMEEAQKYAADFAAEQEASGVVGTYIAVLTRSGECLNSLRW